MEAILKLQSKINRAKAELEQLRGSIHFTNDEIAQREPALVQQISSLQKKLDSEQKNGDI